jgi:hypothetical protein
LLIKATILKTLFDKHYMVGGTSVDNFYKWNNIPKKKGIEIQISSDWETRYVRHHSGSPYKYSEADIKGTLGFLVDNIVSSPQMAEL